MFRVKDGVYSYTEYNEKAKRKGIKGDVISWKELQKEDRKLVKESNSLDKPKKGKAANKLPDATSADVLSNNRNK